MESGNRWISWNGNIAHPYNELYKPNTENEISDIVKNSKNIRVFGEGKSSADIAAGTETLISLENYCSIVSEDIEKREITVQAGIGLKKLIEEVEKRGWAIPCLPDIDAISLGGALSTGTHGTGREGHLLSGYVTAMNIVNAEGNIIDVKEDSKEIEAYRLSLGLLGIISTVTLKCEKIYNLILEEQPVKDSKWFPNYKKLLVENDFTRILWLPHTNYGYQITGNRIAETENIKLKSAPKWHRYRRKISAILYKRSSKKPQFTATANKILSKLFFKAKTKQVGTLYGATVTKSRGSTLELAEWTIALERFDDLFLDLKSLLNDKNNNTYVHIPMDIRFIKSDSTWLSYAYNQDTVTIGCVSRNAADADNYEAFKTVEKIFLKHGGRPHFAKRFSAGAEELKKLYPKWNDFIELRRKIDPNGKFLNSYLKGIFE